jgi:hypothetical protein
MKRLAYRLARWSFHVSYWFHVLGDRLDDLADENPLADALSVYLSVDL